jgi:hypothetical protein
MIQFRATQSNRVRGFQAEPNMPALLDFIDDQGRSR